jgi:nitroimidazol reductase NimA-like FMN-containing flavoprotein (pyridoxamine 5'-phosphate oxidase superfamily)
MSDPATATGVAALDPALLRERLRRARVGRIGYVDADGPAVVPINIVVDAEQRVVFRTAAGGPLANLHGERVAVEIDGFDHQSRSGWSILVRGVARDVTNADDVSAVAVRSAPIDCWAPGVRDKVIVVLAFSITGRVIPVGADGDWFAGVPSS